MVDIKKYKFYKEKKRTVFLSFCLKMEYSDSLLRMLEERIALPLRDATTLDEIRNVGTILRLLSANILLRPYIRKLIGWCLSPTLNDDFISLIRDRNVVELGSKYHSCHHHGGTLRSRSCNQRLRARTSSRSSLYTTPMYRRSQGIWRNGHGR